VRDLLPGQEINSLAGEWPIFKNKLIQALGSQAENVIGDARERLDLNSVARGNQNMIPHILTHSNEVD
jgi:hypothetical protein